MEESQNTGTVTKDDSFQILQKVEDMIDYAYPLIKRWSVADKYAIGNDLMDCMKKSKMRQKAEDTTKMFFAYSTIFGMSLNRYNRMYALVNIRLISIISFMFMNLKRE